MAVGAGAYAATVGVAVGLSALALLPVFLIGEQPRPTTGQQADRPDRAVRSFLPWRNISNPSLAVCVFLPSIAEEEKP